MSREAVRLRTIDALDDDPLSALIAVHFARHPPGVGEGLHCGILARPRGLRKGVRWALVCLPLR